MEPATTSPSAIGRLLQRPVTHVAVVHSRQLEQSDVHVIVVDGETVLFKEVSMQSLRRRMCKTEPKWAVSWQSFVNEASFLRIAPLGELISCGVNVPRVLHCSVHGGEGPVTPLCDPRGVLTVMQYFSPVAWEQQHTVTSLADARSVLMSLAGWHASFWRRKFVWSSPLFAPGGWWRKPLRPSVRYGDIVPSFVRFCAAVGATACDTPTNRVNLGLLADSIDDLTLHLSRGPFNTLIHGDPKSSNWFFRRSRASATASSADDVAVVDFQWTGPARSGAGDVAYFLLGSVDARVLRHHEQELIDTYRAAFAVALEARGGDGADDDTEEEGRICTAGGIHIDWTAEFELEQLAYCATAIPQLLGGLTPASMRANEGAYGFLTHEFDVDAALWLVERASTLAARMRGHLTSSSGRY